MEKIPLNYEASGGDTHKQITNCLPREVVQCLENARFVSLLSTTSPKALCCFVFPDELTSTSSNLAPSRNMHRQRAQRLAHELHLSALITVLIRSGDYYDDKPAIAEDH